MFKKWREERARIKREKWELENLNKEQEDFSSRKNVYLNSQKKQIEFLLENYNRLETKYNILRQMILEQKNNKKLGWRVNQFADGETEWVRQNEVTYVSKIYTTGPENAFYFDAIIDGQKITFSAPTIEEMRDRKLKLLDVERIEEFDEIEQQERFNSDKA